MKTHPTKGYMIPEVVPLEEVSIIIDTWNVGQSRHNPQVFSIDVEFRREVSDLNKEFYGLTPAQFDRLMITLQNSNEWVGSVDPTHGIYVRDRGRHPDLNATCMIVNFKRKE